jgi:hypothetical protein
MSNNSTLNRYSRILSRPEIPYYLIIWSTIFLGALVWNFFIWAISTGKLFGCFALGGWGLFWYNDNGLLNE